MAIDNLKESLKQLHANLEGTSTVDPELRQLLRTLDSDIQKLIQDDAAVASSDEDASLAERAQLLSVKFANEHPRLESVLRELTATLERMGI